MAETIAKVRIGLSVDEQTAKTCLKIVELYVNENDMELEESVDDNGYSHFGFHEIFDDEDDEDELTVETIANMLDEMADAGYIRICGGNDAFTVAESYVEDADE